MDKKPENIGDLGEFFNIIGKAKKQKEDEFRSVVGDINLDGIFDNLKEENKKIKKKKKKEKKQIEQLEKFLFEDVDKKEEPKKEEIPEDQEVPDENTKVGLTEKVEEVEEEIVAEVESEEIQENDHVDEAIKVLDKIVSSKEEISEETDYELIKKEIKELRTLIHRNVNGTSGGGEVRLEFLDDVDRDTAKVDGKFLKYDSSSGKFVGASGGAGSQGLNDTLGIGNTSDIGMSVGVVTATSFVGNGVSLTGIVTSIVAGSNVTISGSTGRVTINASGGGGGTGGKFNDDQTNSGIHTTSSNVGLGTTNPRYQLEVGSVGAGGTQLWVNGDARITGILSVGTATITLDPTTNKVQIGTGITIDATTNTIEVAGSKIADNSGNAEFTGIVTATTVQVGSATTIHSSGIDLGNGNITSHNINSTGIITSAQLNVTGISTFANDISIANKIVHTGDTDTAIRFPATNRFAVETAGVEALRVDGSQRVGIGTDDLQARFTVYSAASNAYTREIRIDASDAPSGSNGHGIYRILGDGNSLGKYIIGYNSTHPSQPNDVSLKNSDGDISFHNAANGTPAEKLRITTTGRIGINESNPAYTLDLGESASTIRLVSEDGGTAIRIGPGGDSNDITLIRVDGASNAHDGESDSAKLGFSLKYMGSRSQNANSLSLFSDNQQAGTQIEAVTVFQDGTVGINSTIPSERLDVEGTTQTSQLNVTGVSTFQSHVELGDDDELRLGDNKDLRLYHDGSNSYVADNGVGSLILASTFGGVLIRKHNVTETMAGFNPDSSVDLYYNGDKKFETTASGIDVTGHTETDTLRVSGVSTFQDNVNLGDNTQIVLGDGPDLKIYHDGSNSYVEDTGVGALIMKGSTLRFRSTTNEKIINAHQNGSVDLFYDNSKKLATTNIGIAVSNGTSDTATITGPANLIIDPAVVGDNTGLVRIKGDLYVDGEEFKVDSTTINLADHKVGIATTSETNLLLDGAGIGIGPDSNQKTFLYEHNSGTNPSLKSSENLNVASGKGYQINQTEVLNSTTLGSGVINSSLTSVGTLGSLTVSGNVSIADKIVHTGDTNTAIRFPADDTISADTGGAERIRITSDGKIGIGIQSPAYDLDLGESASTIRLVSEDGGTAIRMGAGGSGNDITLIRVDGGGGSFHGESDSAKFGFSLKYLGSGSGNANALSIFSDNQSGTQVEAVTVFQDGIVGINSTIPSERLDVGGTTQTSQLNVTGVSTFANTISIAETIEHTGDTNTSISFPSTDYIRLTTSGSSRLNVTPNGYILLGTNSEPSGGDAHSRNARLLIHGRVGNAADSGRINLQRGSSASNGSSIGSLTFTDNGNNAYARIETLADAAPGTDDYPGRIVFSTTPDGSASPTERLRIDSSGRLLVGTTSSSGDHILEVNSGTDNEGIKVVSTDGGSYIRFADNSTTAQIRLGAVGDDFKIDVNASERLRIDSNGDVGIGIADPQERLHVARIVMVTGNTPQIRLNANDSDASDDDRTMLGQATANGNFVTTAVDNDTVLRGTSTGNLLFGVGTAEKFRITSAGKFGFGTNSPQGTVHISSGTSGDATLILEADTDNSNDADNPYIVFRQDGGINASAIGHGVDSGVNGNVLTIANSITDGAITFATGATNGYTNATERLRITRNGRVGIGTDTPEYDLDLGKSASTIRLVSEDGGTAIRIGPGGDSNDITLIRVDGASNAHDGESNSAKLGFSLKYMGSRSQNANSLSLFSDNQQAGTQIEAVTVFQDGTVGINSTIPSERLDVGGTTQTEQLNVTGVSTFTSSHHSFAKITRSSNGTALQLINTSTADGASVDHSFVIDGSTRARIRGNIHGGSLGGNLRFYTTDDTQTLQQRAIFDKNGRFGINVASPTKTLDVGGNAKISGDLEVTGSHGLSSKYTHQKITSSGSATETLNQSGRTATDIIIFVNGIAFLPTDDYSVSGTTLTFVEAPASGAVISVRYLPT